MKITWIGQAGLLFETENKKIIVDPYLSDSVAKVQPHNFRRINVDNRFLELKPDIIILTHNHLDHTDKETLCHYLDKKSEVIVLAPYSAWRETKKFGGFKNNYVLFESGTSWTEQNIVFRAVKAEHSDNYAIGVIISAERKNFYITGDTLYSERVFESMPKMKFEAVFLPINGTGNNMNMADAAKFSERVGAKYTVPIHFGMFDDIKAKNFICKNRIIPEIYKEILLEKT